MQGFIPKELVADEVRWFYQGLGIDDSYFQNESPKVITDHIIALFGAKVLAYVAQCMTLCAFELILRLYRSTKSDPNKIVIDLEKIDDNGATFIHTSEPGITTTEGPGTTCESRFVTCRFRRNNLTNASL